MGPHTTGRLWLSCGGMGSEHATEMDSVHRAINRSATWQADLNNDGDSKHLRPRVGCIPVRDNQLLEITAADLNGDGMTDESDLALIAP